MREELQPGGRENQVLLRSIAFSKQSHDLDMGVPQASSTPNSGHDRAFHSETFQPAPGSETTHYALPAAWEFDVRNVKSSTFSHLGVSVSAFEPPRQSRGGNVRNTPNSEDGTAAEPEGSSGTSMNSSPRAPQRAVDAEIHQSTETDSFSQINQLESRPGHALHQFLGPYFAASTVLDIALDFLVLLSLLPSRTTGDFAVRQIPYHRLPWNQLLPYLLWHQLVLLRLVTLSLVAARLARVERRQKGSWTLFGFGLTWERGLACFCACWALNAAFLVLADMHMSQSATAVRVEGWLPAK